jgi:ATP-binding cassette subfamily F protein 3
MLAVDKVTIQFGARVLFKDLSFVLSPKDRIALAGPNGAGKSTLMKIIAGIEKADSGKITKSKTSTIGYLPQEGVSTSGLTVFEEAATAFQDVLQLQEQIDELDGQLEKLDPTSDKYANYLEDIGELQIRLEHHDASRVKPQIETVLQGLGFSLPDLKRDCGEFSGGWQMRIALAKLLLAEPSVLLLDEPTNHLDIDTVQWIEQFLLGYPGAIIIISHDLSLLDVLTKRTIAFEQGRAEEYSGNFSFYLRERVARRELLERAFKNQQRHIEKEEALINRFRAKASKATMAQSRLKQLNKIERIELESDDAEISFKFPQPRPSGHTVIQMEGINKSYGDLHVLKDVDFEILNGERLAIVGVNGAGKSTFSRLLSGKEEATSGLRKEGHNVTISHFSQNHADELDPKKTVLETIEAVGAPASGTNVRTLLGSFLFRGDDVYKQVGVLSGGERSRLALARMLLRPANFLVLDEPTNHLDVMSQEVLRRALDEYQGTYAIVSHNRSFLDPIVTKVLEFRVGQPPKFYYGNVSDYIEKKRADNEAAAAKSAPSKAQTVAQSTSPKNRKEERRLDSLKRQERSKKLKPLQEKLEATEATIAQIEARRAEITQLLSDPKTFEDQDSAKELGEEFKQSAIDLNTAYSDWDKVSTDIERAEAEFG